MQPFGQSAAPIFRGLRRCRTSCWGPRAPGEAPDPRCALKARAGHRATRIERASPTKTRPTVMRSAVLEGTLDGREQFKAWERLPGRLFPDLNGSTPKRAVTPTRSLRQAISFCFSRFRVIWGVYRRRPLRPAAPRRRWANRRRTPGVRERFCGLRLRETLSIARLRWAGSWATCPRISRPDSS
jgi:hypothetical protein